MLSIPSAMSRVFLGPLRGAILVVYIGEEEFLEGRSQLCCLVALAPLVFVGEEKKQSRQGEDSSRCETLGA